MLQPIPFTKGFTASASGIIHGPEGNVRNQYTNGDGYKTASVLMEDGRWVTFGVHRLIALAFKPPETDHLLLTVNHIDGDILNNTPPNVEWVSNRDNIIHGTLLNRFNHRPLIACSKDKETFWLNDLYDAAYHFEQDIDFIWARIKDSELIDGWKVEHVKSSDKRIAKMKIARPNPGRKARGIRMWNLISGVVKDFDSMADAAKFFKVETTHIRIRVSTPGFPKIFKRAWVIVDMEEGFDFLVPDVIALLVSRGAKPILCYNPSLNVYEEYSSAYGFLKKYPALSKKAITTRLKKGQLTPSDGWIVKIIENRTQDKVKMYEMARSLGLVK